MNDFLIQLQTEYEHIAKSRIGRLEPGLSADDVVSACKNIVDDVRTHRISIDNIIKTHLDPMLKSIANISDEDEASLFETAQQISSYETRLDPGLAYKIYQSLLKRARENKDTDSIIKYLYWCGITLFYLNKGQDKKILSYFEEGASYYNRYRKIQNEETRKYIHRCLGNHHMMLFSVDQPEKAMELEGKIFNFWNSLIFSDIDPDFPWLTYFLTCLTHNHAYIAKTAHSDPDSETKENLQNILDIAITINKLYNKNRELFSVHGGTRYEYMLWEAQFLSGLISFDQLRENIYNKQKTFEADDYSSDAIYTKINLFSFLMHYAITMDALSEIKTEVVKEALNYVVSYISAIPKTENTREVTRQLRSFAGNLGEVIKPMEQLDFILKLTTFRYIPTYAHSIMVGKIATYLTKFLIEKDPGYFIGCMGLTSISDVKANVNKLYEFTELCGLCHDAGKFIYDNNPFLLARVLTDDELEIVKLHPEEGFSIFSENDNIQVSDYTDIILGHHKHYDDSSGYPESFKIAKSKNRAIIDIIKVSDSIDAATDDVGKAYSDAKSPEEIFAEIREGAGCEYSPVLAKLLDEAPVISMIKNILDTERKDAYFTAYSHAWS